LRAVVFDLDALADIECGGHRLAFNAAFAAHGLNLNWSVPRYRRLLALSDERQRVAAELRARGVRTECDVLAALLVDQICTTKALMVDQVLLRADLAPRAGLVDLVTEAFAAGVAVGVVARGARSWTEPLVRQLVGDGVVATVVTADDVAKPMPTADGYRLALAELGVTPAQALAFAGSTSGLRCARAAGLPVEVVDADDAGARASYEGLRLADCQRLQAHWWATHRRSAAA
jgi:beta-phosphoglucomutase-like phosphatase (HAD superfamily)